MSEPAIVVFEGGALPGVAHARPQPSHEVRRALQVDVDENFFVHYFIPVCRRDSRMRCGKRSSSSSRPTASCRGSATSAKRPDMPSENSTVAYAPAETVGSPFSILFRVILLMEDLCARIATGMRRR